MNNILLESAIIELDSISVLSKLITTAMTSLSNEELQQACYLMQEVIESKVKSVQDTFYK